MNKDSIILEIKKLPIDVTENQLKQLEIYADYLLEYNKTTNLTGIKTIDEVYLKHFYDSLLICKYYDFSNTNNLLDIGSGAGFPGVIIKIFFPNINVTLLDANNKKVTFLNKLIDKLGLTGINAVNDRAENYVKKNRNAFDITVARAVSEMRIISELAIPFTKKDGYFIAFKGNYPEELKNSENTINILNANIEKIEKDSLPFINDERTFIFVKVNDITLDKYPRSYEQILKKPLK